MSNDNRGAESRTAAPGGDQVLLPPCAAEGRGRRLRESGRPYGAWGALCFRIDGLAGITLGLVSRSDDQPATSSDDSSEPSLSDETSLGRGGKNVVPDWLPENLRAWVTTHRIALEAVFGAVIQNAQWPDPVQLQRQQRAAGGHPAIALVLAGMPRQLGWREYEPPRARLSLFGIACCHGSGPVLSAYFQLLQLALERHSDPDSPDRLCRRDADSLTRCPAEARLLSRVVLDDCPFLGSGSTGLDDWDREIDERAVEYAQARSIDDFLAVLAEQRGLTAAQQDSSAADRAAAPEPPPAPPSADVPLEPSAGPQRVPARLAHAAGALVFVASLGGLVLAITGSSLPPVLAVSVACALSFVLPLWRPQMALGRVVSAVAVAALLGAAAGSVIGESTTPSISSQLDAVLKQAVDRGTYPAVRRTLRLHRGAPRSQLIVLRDDSERPGGIPRELALPPSDELRLYDEVGGRLDLRLAFHPQNPGEVQQGPDGDFPGYRLQVMQVMDVNRDGNAEVLLSFERRSNASGPLPVPVLLWWDAAADAYRVDPILTEAPELRVAPGLSTEALDGYRKPSLVSDQRSENRLVGFPADAIAVRHALRGPVVLAGYAEVSTVGFTGRYEAVGWFLSLAGGRLQLTRCTPKRRHLFVKPSTPAQIEDALARAVIDSGRYRGCGQP
jgi:hypothetical protein